MSVSVRAAFDNAVVYFIGGDCVTQPFYGSASAAGCGEVFTFTSACLPAGDYFFVVGLNAFTGLPYGGLNNGYRAWVDCTPCEVPTGRCCYYDLGTPACATNFEIECGNLGGLWTEGENCVDQPCAFGACCYNDGLCCDELFDFDCAALGGVFNGVGTLCQTVECTRTCSVTPGVTDIIEPLEADSCGFTFVDPNGGCNNTVPSFTQMACGDTVAGISYYYCDNGGGPQYRDTDWYEFTITQAQDVSVSAIADVSGYLVGIIAAPCPNGSFTALAFDAGCGTVATATAFCLPAGTYFAWFGLVGNLCTTFDSPSNYRLWVDCAPATSCPIGRCCYDGGLSCADNTSDECLALGGDWDGSTNCAAGPCPVPVDNDDCENAEVIVTVNNGSVTTASGAEGATFTCAGPVCGDLCTFSGSTSIDQFYTFTLTECRLLAIVGDGPSAFACDPALAVYPDGECCGVADACNDDWGCNGDLDLLPWLPPVLRPVANYGSMIADSFGPGTYYIRAGHFGASWNGIYDLTIYDFGPCVIAPCDPVVDLTIFIETAASQPTNVQLFWTAPQTDDYKVWATTNPMNDGNPDDGADADFTLVATILGVPAGPTSWQAPAGFAGLPPVGGPTFYVVTAVCEPFVEPTGRCCYEDLCADVTAAECANLAGTWDQFLTCADPCPLTGGETVNDPFVIGALPYSATGNTCSNVNDYDETCPYSGSLSPDVVFAYTPGANSVINLSMCAGSDYDTKLYIYENAVTPGLPYACNDDFCPGFVSELTGVAVTGGNTYYIIVDGYGSACGNYTLDITE
ncbi:MAG: hypothetical protein IPH10_09240 [bacterium]|nr:hypothetical protein [bacterium]